MAHYGYETLNDETRAYINQVFLDEGKTLPVAVARTTSLSITSIFIVAILLMVCYFSLFFPPLGNPLKETLILTAFCFPSLWFLWIATRSALKFDRNYRSPRFCFADGNALWICKGSTVDHFPLTPAILAECHATENKVTVKIRENNRVVSTIGSIYTKSASVPSLISQFSELAHFLNCHYILANNGVLKDLTDTHAIGRRVMMARGLYDYCLSNLNQSSEQIQCMPQGFVLTSPCAEAEPGQEPAAPTIHMAISWDTADTTAWRSLAAKQLDVHGEKPTSDDPAFAKAAECRAERPQTSSVIPALAICAFLLLLFYGGLHAIIYVRDGAIMEIIQENSFPPDQIRTYLADDRNTRHRPELLQRMQLLYAQKLSPLNASLKDSHPVLGPEFRTMVQSLAQTPQPLWSMTTSGPGANQAGMALKNGICRLLDMGNGPGVVWTDPPEGIAPHFAISLEPQAGHSVAVTVRLTNTPSSPDSFVSATWNTTGPEVSQSVLERLTGLKPAPATPANNPGPTPVGPTLADKPGPLPGLKPKDRLDEFIKAVLKDQKDREKLRKSGSDQATPKP